MRTFVIASLFFGLVCSIPVGAVAQSADSPVGTWAITILGPDRGIAYMTFSNDFSITGYGISVESFGPFTTDGQWLNDSKGRVTGGYTQSTLNESNFWSFVAKVKGNDNFRGVERPPLQDPRQVLKGQDTNSVPDVSGDWVGEVVTWGDKFFENYTFTASTNMAGWFDVTGQGVSSSGSFTISGGLIVTPKRRANGYTIRDFGVSGSITSSFDGQFNSPLDQILFKGKDDENHKVVIRTRKN